MMEKALKWLSSFALVTLLTTSIAATATAGKETTTTAAANTSAHLVIPLGKNSSLVPQPPALDAGAYVISDFNTGQILAVKNPDQRMAPASLTKLMTLYVISNALQHGQIHLDDQVRISKKAWKMGGSKMFVRIGTTVPVEKLVQGIIVDSGNDACVAMSEHVAGSEDAFVDLMNQQAKKLGMTNSHFVDCTGMPHDGHYSTPHDMAVLARELIKEFPQYYSWYKQKWLTYNGIKQPNRNRLLWRDPSVDGLKTGHTESAGYCLVASALRGNNRMISVVMKAPSDNARAQDSQQLLTYGFRFFDSPKVATANTALATPRVWGGKDKTITAGITEDVFVTVPQGQAASIQKNITISTPLKAPIARGDTIGTMTVTLNGQTISQHPIVALTDDPSGSAWVRIKDRIGQSFHRLFHSKPA
ncbi:MAG: D-alanyl-D-alanine carboxypeptidase [marine bacterium B5-7]|nr:MAG: D-alanyl-D-alanine carboxypeptidase [marine bacterium B5-7]